MLRSHSNTHFHYCRDVYIQTKNTCPLLMATFLVKFILFSSVGYLLALYGFVCCSPFFLIYNIF
uniref:Uncharacterized protein n=1 Tax=Arundo donax TaxID=35708 RepID=A0A0A9FJL0_ARUDO